ncbi:FAD/NAD(P)-binding protein [Nocardia sp. CDC159]|uniref:FAD/NAD(P)-binding protein n=1 Tax=Nocardia pulmonis TaxID=2951408 RepID=A0A9X2IX72_9NOCA|nr:MULTISPECIES: FAD/NAD(P)-binding protein [Nocardia]MCM6774324.1 FAD/NAD(P)-binding protein [Nocardia pulmonis]MCM6787610.1 FAD/NAD(P)-binding protein [Nocardia sp. CDC159]
MRIAVIGAGAAATSVVSAVAASTDTPLEICVFDHHPLGESLAFSRHSQAGVCNTSDAVNAAALGLLGAAVPDEGPASFRPRSDIGVALAVVAARLRSDDRIVLREHLGTVVRLDPSGESIDVTTDSGNRYRGFDRVFVCRGLSTPHVPETLRALSGREEVWSSPYPLDDCAAALRDRRVLVVGASLSAIECATEIAQGGSTVTIASREAQLPSVRASLSDDPELLNLCTTSLAVAAPANAAAMTRFARAFAEILGTPFGAAIGERPGRTVIDTLLAELEHAQSERHWSAAVVPLCRAVNAAPRLAAPARAALEGNELRRYTNGITTGSAALLARLLTERRIRHERLGVLTAGRRRSGAFEMETPDGWQRYDAVVLACGWQPPDTIAGLAQCRIAHSAADLRQPGPCVMRIGVEARDRVALPNALFALHDQIAVLRAGMDSRSPKLVHGS